MDRYQADRPAFALPVAIEVTEPAAADRTVAGG